MDIRLKWLGRCLLIGALFIPVQVSAAAGVCRNDVNGSCGAVKNPCQPQEDAVQKLTAQVVKTQQELNTVNSVQAEKQIKDLKEVVKTDQAALTKPGLSARTIHDLKQEIAKDEKLIADQQSSVQKLLNQIDKLQRRLGKANKKLDDCRNKNSNK